MMMRWPLAGCMSSITLVCSASVSGHHVTWPIAILPSRVAGPVAAKALQWSIAESRLRSKYDGASRCSPSNPVGVIGIAPRNSPSSTVVLATAISTRSMRRPSHFAPMRNDEVFVNHLADNVLVHQLDLRHLMGGAEPVKEVQEGNPAF